MKTQTCLITNGATGVGFEIAKAMATKGYRVILTCRNKDCGAYAGRLIMEKSKNVDVDVICTDFHTVDGIPQFCDRLQQLTSSVDVFINTMPLDEFQSKKRHQFLPSFLLTQKLLPFLKNGEKAKIVFVSNTAAKINKLRYEDLMALVEPSLASCLEQNRLAHAIYVQKLSEELMDMGITVNSIAIGNVKNNGSEDAMLPLLKNVLRKKAEKAVQPVVDMVSDPVFDTKTGYSFKKYREIKEVPLVYNENVKSRLWQVSERLTGLYRSHKEYVVQLAS